MSVNSQYTLKREEGKLIFITSSYRDEKGSILHEYIDNHEFASMMSAMIICGVAYVIIASNYDLHILHYISLILLFVLFFILLRRYVFKERFLKVVLDGNSGSAGIKTPLIFGERSEEIPLSDVDSVEIGSRKILPVDKDAEKFVEKIATQHGSVVPGLADEIEFVTL